MIAWLRRLLWAPPGPRRVKRCWCAKGYGFRLPVWCKRDCERLPRSDGGVL